MAMTVPDAAKTMTGLLPFLSDQGPASIDTKMGGTVCSIRL